MENLIKMKEASVSLQFALMDEILENMVSAIDHLQDKDILDICEWLSNQISDLKVKVNTIRTIAMENNQLKKALKKQE